MLDWQRAYTLSRFVILHRMNEGLVMSSPLSNRSFQIQGTTALRLLSVLSRPIQLDALLSTIEESQRSPVKAFLEACDGAGLLTPVNNAGDCEEDLSELSHWELHDLFFHACSRLGRNPNPIGATYRLRERTEPEPIILDALPASSIPLPQPTPGIQRPESLVDVLERRRSGCGPDPFDLYRLGTFLYRTCRITAVIKDGDSAYVKKVYPSGGSLHPLCVYVVINNCSGCAAGLYRYHDLKHALIPVRAMDESVNQLLLDAQNSAGYTAALPPVLFIISARFRRTAWKYESIAYRLILLETGGLFQTMYLVATNMGLGGCALGCGDSDQFARAVGTNYYLETSVGEFLLGAPAIIQTS